MLQCVAMCCSVVQPHGHAAVYTVKPVSDSLQCVAVCCSVLQCVAVCCSVLRCAAVRQFDIELVKLSVL